MMSIEQGLPSKFVAVVSHKLHQEASQTIVLGPNLDGLQQPPKAGFRSD